MDQPATSADITLQPATSADITLQPATSADITLCYCGVLMMQGTPGLCKTSSLPRRRTLRLIGQQKLESDRVTLAAESQRGVTTCDNQTPGDVHVLHDMEKSLCPQGKTGISPTVFFHFALSKLTCHDFASYFAYICLSLPILN